MLLHLLGWFPILVSVVQLLELGDSVIAEAPVAGVINNRKYNQSCEISPIKAYRGMAKSSVRDTRIRILLLPRTASMSHPSFDVWEVHWQFVRCS